MSGTESLELMANLAGDHTAWCDPGVCVTDEWASVHERLLASCATADVTLQQYRPTDSLGEPPRVFASVSFAGRGLEQELSAAQLRDLAGALAQAADRMEVLVTGGDA